MQVRTQEGYFLSERRSLCNRCRDTWPLVFDPIDPCPVSLFLLSLPPLHPPPNPTSKEQPCQLPPPPPRPGPRSSPRARATHRHPFSTTAAKRSSNIVEGRDLSYNTNISILVVNISDDCLSCFSLFSDACDSDAIEKIRRKTFLRLRVAETRIMGILYHAKNSL